MKFRLQLITLLFMIVISSCKKESPVLAYPVEGLWLGRYSVNTVPSQGQLFYSFTVNPDGTITTKAKGGDGNDYYSSGKWTLSADNVFTATITAFTSNAKPGITQSITTTFSDTGVMTNGTWKDINNPYGPALSGKFSVMQRVN